MNALEMHIEVNQSVQKVAANRNRKIFPDEIDWVLNKQVHRFIQDRIKPRRDSDGFEIDQLGIDAMRNIIVSMKECTAYVDSPTRFKVPLPADYKYMLSDASYAVNLCNSPALNPIPVTLPISTLKQVYSTKGAPLYYESMSLAFNGNGYAFPAQLPLSHKYTGYQSKQDVVFLVANILDRYRKLGFNLYWEQYGKMYLPNTYILVGAVGQTLALPSMVIDGAAVTQRTTTSENLLVAPGTTDVLVDNRLSRSDRIHALMSTAYFKPNVLSPISELDGSYLYVYTDKTFIVNKVSLTYVRKVRPISLALGSDCELTEEFHQTICDRASEYILGRLQTGTESIIKDNEQRVIL